MSDNINGASMPNWVEDRTTAGSSRATEFQDERQSKMMKDYINGVSMPKVQDSTTAGSSRATECNIAALYVSPTNCSLAYSLAGSKSVNLLPLDTNGNYRVPCSILIDSESNVKAFGHHARKVYSGLSVEKKQHHYYFNELKIQLQNDEKVSWTTKICAMNGKEFFLLEIIAMILKYLKYQFFKVNFSNSMRGQVKASDFDWVITVPAMWRLRGKVIMREAAYKAGIASEGVEISCLTPVQYDQISGKNLVTVPTKILDTDSIQPEKLLLAHESESVALYCKNEAEKEARNFGITFQPPNCYMVLDIGGRTVNISIHKVEPSGGLRILTALSVKNLGGTKVNQRFKQFLGRFVEDHNFSRYISCSSPNPKSLKHSADLDDLINGNFEQHKRLYGNNDLPSDEIVVNLPFSFIHVYGDDLQRAVAQPNNENIDFSEDELVLSSSVIDSFFEDAISEIKVCVLKTLQDIPKDDRVDGVYFVGGFGGCKYLYNKLERAIKEDYNPSCMTYRPDDHETAAVIGAALFRQNPEVISCRVIDATYGTSCSKNFLPYHNPAYKFYDDDREEHCSHLFAPFTLKGDVVSTNKVLVHTFVPLSHYQSSMTFTIYASQDKNIPYVVGERGQALGNIIVIGELTVKMPDMSGDKNRKVNLSFYFSDTEIRIEAYDQTSGCRAMTMVNFFTDLIDIAPQMYGVL